MFSKLKEKLKSWTQNLVKKEIAEAEKEIVDYEETIQNIDKKDFVNGLIPALEITKDEEYAITETDDKKIIDQYIEILKKVENLKNTLQD